MAARNGVDVIKERKVEAAAQLTFGHAYAEYMASLARKGACAMTIASAKRTIGCISESLRMWRCGHYAGSSFVISTRHSNPGG